MKLRLNSTHIMDEIILTGSILNVMIFNWLGISGDVNIILFVLIMISVFYYLKKYANVAIPLLFVAAIVIVPFYNYRQFGGSFDVLLSNMKGIIQRLLFLVYVCFLMTYSKEFLREYLRKNVAFFNVFLICNVPFIILQCMGMYSLVSLHGADNTYHVDTISGLFGMDGVAYMAMYVGFLTVYNIHYSLRYAGYNKRFFGLYSVVCSLGILALGFVNDNKGLFIIMPLCIAVYYMVGYLKGIYNNSIYRGIWKLLMSIVKWAGSMLVIYYLLYYIVPPFKKMMENIFHIMGDVTNSFIIGGSNERFRMIWVAWKDKEHLIWGNGMGRYHWKEERLFGFYHYGQSDFGTFMLIGGIAFLIALFGYILLLLNKVFNNLIVASLLTMVFMVSAVFTLEFTAVSPFTSTVLFVMVCWWNFTEENDCEKAKRVLRIRTMHNNHIA